MAEQDKVNINTPYIGMNLENDPSTFEEGELSFVLNGIMNEGFSDVPHISNAPGNELAVSYPDGYVLLNSTIMDRKSKVCFLVNPATNISQIGVVFENKYTKSVESAKLGFRVDSQIQAKVKRSYNGDYITYWLDNYNPIRLMNLTKPPYIRIKNPDNSYTITDELDTDQLKIFKNYDLPELDIAEIMNIGKIPSCGLFITMQYADARGNGLTAWHRMSNKIPIIRDSIADAYENITGCISNIPTNKAVKVKITNPDLSFTHINIGVIKVIDGAPSGFKVATISVAQDEYIYTGANTEIPILLADLIAPPIVYESGKTIDESDGSLVIGNLKGKKKLNLQPYVNRIQIQWQAYRTIAKNRQQSHKNPLFAAYKQSYRRDEVIPLGLIIEFNDGTESEAFPMVGRALNKTSNGLSFTQSGDIYGNPINPTTWDSQVLPMNEDVYENTTLPRWKIYNTATNQGNKATGSAEGLSYYGECGYWESTDRYPDNRAVWGDIAGKPMRFPKTPDTSILPLTIKDNDINFVFHLGFVFPNIDEVLNSIPADIKEQIKGWRIVRADRKFNKSIIASGLLYNCFEQDFRSRREDDPDIRLYPNYPLNDLRSDQYINRAFSGPLIPPIFGGDSNTANDHYRKDIFTFLSPDTTLQKAALTNAELKINAEYRGTAECYHRFVDPFPLLNEHGDDNARSAIQAMAIGEYKTMIPSSYGNTRRLLKEAMYIPFNSNVSGGNAGRVMWNKGRESTVLLATERQINDPVLQDRSRFIMTNSDTPPAGEEFTADPENANISHKVNRPISAHYATVKLNLPNQYGSIFNLKFVETGYTSTKYKAEGICLGGDTYIGMFSAKRLMTFYNELQKWMNSAKGAEGLDTKANMVMPGIKYYYRNTGGNARNNSHMMLEDNTGWFLGDGKDLGYITTFMNGISLFYVESDVNVELRYEGDQEHEAFYPAMHDGATQVEDWLGIKHIDKDNIYNNNIDLSGYNDLRSIANIDPLFEPDNNDITHYSTRAIKSLRSQPEDIYDNWQVFKPLDYFDFPKSRGELWDIRYVGQSRTLFRFERSLYYSALQQSIATSEGQITLGTGRLFSQDPTDLVYTDLGYAGSRSQWAFNSTEFGAFFADPDNGKVFNFSEGIKEISNNKASAWFDKNLRFKLSNDIPGIPTDNPANPNGIGIHSTWSKQKLWILTKKDYEVLDRTKLSQFEYRDGNIYFNGAVVSLKDESLFVNKSWSIAYSPITQRWFTFYSFIPDYYILDADAVLSVVNENGTSKVYDHSSGTKMQTFYGKYYPFIIEMVNKLDGINPYISAHSSFICRSLIKQQGEWTPLQNRSFNKAIVYNHVQCSGTLNLVIQDENNLYLLRRSLQRRTDSMDIALRFRNSIWNFSDYCDISKTENFFTANWNNPKFRQSYFIDKVLNDPALDYSNNWKQGTMIRGLSTKTRLMLDNADDLKLLFQVGIEAARLSYS